VWRSTSAIHLPGLAQIEKEIDSLTRADTDNRLTDDLILTYLYLDAEHQMIIIFNLLTINNIFICETLHSDLLIFT